jgi:hypothetical protein
MNGGWTHDELQRCLTQKQQWVEQKTSKAPNEAATKNGCIEPILRALGWDTSDIDEVDPEWGKTQAAGRADYALISEPGGHPIAVLEAKSLTTTISDKDVAQTLQYAQLQQVTWAIVTNGRNWRLYDALKQAQWTDRKVWDIAISDANAVDKLTQIAKSNLPELKQRLERAQDEGLVARTIHRLMVSPTTELVAVLSKETGLPAKRVREAINQLGGRISSPELTAAVSPAPVRKLASRAAAIAVISPPAVTEHNELTEGGSSITHNKPSGFRIGDQIFEARSWRDIWVASASHVLDIAPTAFDRAAKSDEFAGRLRRTIGTDPAVMRSAYPVGRYFIEVNLSGESLIALSRRLVAFALPGVAFSFTVNEPIS